MKQMWKFSPSWATLALFLVFLDLGMSPDLCHGQLLVGEPTPTEGAEGTEVTVFGSGFSSEASDHVAYVLAPDNHVGVVLEIDHAEDSQLSGTLGAAGKEFVGTVVVQRGRSYDLPKALYTRSHGTYLVTSAIWFIGNDVAESGNTFTITEINPDLDFGEALDRYFWLNSKKLDQDTTVEVSTIIDGGTLPPLKFGLAANLVLEYLARNDNDVRASEETVATDLADILNATFGAFGLIAEANGPAVRIYPPVPFERGFTNLKLVSRK